VAVAARHACSGCCRSSPCQPSSGEPSGQLLVASAFERIAAPTARCSQHVREAALPVPRGSSVELLQALIATESGFEPSAVSPKGAVGPDAGHARYGRALGWPADRWAASIEKKLADPRHQRRNRGTRYLRRTSINCSRASSSWRWRPTTRGRRRCNARATPVPNYREKPRTTSRP